MNCESHGGDWRQTGCLERQIFFTLTRDFVKEHAEEPSEFVHDFLFLFVLLVCRPIFDSAKRKTRSVSPHRFTVPSHSSLPRARIHPGRQFCAFFYGSFGRSKQANLSTKCDRVGFLRKSFVRGNIHCEIFRIDFPHFPLVRRRFTGRRSFFALVGVLVTGSEGGEKHDEHVLCSTSTAA